MPHVTIPITEEQMARLKDLAQKVGLAPEQLLEAGVEDFLGRHDDEFTRMADFIITKNTELYRRLA